jgi:hypothetical protein
MEIEKAGTVTSGGTAYLSLRRPDVEDSTSPILKL